MFTGAGTTFRKSVISMIIIFVRLTVTSQVVVWIILDFYCLSCII